MNVFWPLHSVKVSMNFIYWSAEVLMIHMNMSKFQLYCLPLALKMVQDIERELNQSTLRLSISILQQNGDSRWPSHRVIYFSFV